MNFGKSVRESVALCVTTLEEITAAEKELAAARKAGKIAPADAEAKSAELACARADALGTVNTRIERDRLAHHAAVDEWNTADGSKIDTGDLKLLQADFHFDPAQFQALCDKHRDNATMLQLLAEYSEKHRDWNLTADRPIGAQARKDAFDRFCRDASSAARDPNSVHAALWLSGNGTAESVFIDY